MKLRNSRAFQNPLQVALRDATPWWEESLFMSHPAQKATPQTHHHSWDLPAKGSVPSAQRGKSPWDNGDPGACEEMGEAVALALPQI